MNNMHESRLLGGRSTVASAVLLALMTSGAAYGQAADSDVATLAEVQVTASRIQRTGFEAPTPTTMVGADQIEARAAVRVSQVLFEIPALRPTATAVPFSASAGGSYANLRNLNPGAPTQTATRTLVLVDGHRVVPNTATGLVDLNSIPTSLIERVEVVTGGASAAWGSDAVAGVTNFILKKKVDGFDTSVQYGQSGHGDFQEKNLSLAWGTSYSEGRGEVMVAGEYSDLDDIASYADRSWGRHQYGWVSGTIDGRNVTRITMPGVVSSGVTAGGVIVAANGGPVAASSPLRGIQFGPGGQAQPFQYGTYLGNNQMVGGSGPALSLMGKLGAPVTRMNALGRTTFAFTDTLNGFAELAYAESKSIVQTQPTYLPNGDPILTIQRDNAFLPTSVRNLMPVGTTFGLGRFIPEFGEYSLGASRTAVTRAAAGLDGKFGDGWKWDAYVGAGSTDYYDKALNNINEPNLRAAVDSVIGPDGTPICRINSQVASDIAITSAANYQGRGAAAGCVAANPFGAGSFTPAVVNYVVGTSAATATIKQQSAGASLQGEPFSTWAGAVSIAGGLDYRRDSVDQTADATAQATTPAFQTGSWQFANRRPINGSYNVKELFAETLVPLAKGITMLQELNLNAAARVSDYSTSGSVTSWKAGLTWGPGGGLRLRATQSRDVRAANLVELYTVGVSIVGGVVDYGRPGNPTPSVPTTTIGNPDLKPETADTTTIGFTWQPSFVPGLQASIDYFKIDLKDAIGSLGGQNIVNACYGAGAFAGKARPELCPLIARDSSGVISNITNQNLNLAFANTRGVDMELSYAFGLDQLFSSASGRMTLRLLGTYTDVSNENNGIVTVDRAGQIGNSRWRMASSASYNNGPLDLFLQARYLDAAKIDVTYGPNDIDNNRVPSYIYLNGSVQYTLFNSETRGRLQLFGNVNNIFDKAPPLVPSASPAPGQTALAPDYDKIGRYFSLGARYHF
ncbi:MAG: TonB-dependent receptor [Steroidobacteraceae bacterium]